MIELVLVNSLWLDASIFLLLNSVSAVQYSVITV